MCSMDLDNLEACLQGPSGGSFEVRDNFMNAFLLQFQRWFFLCKKRYRRWRNILPTAI